MPLKDIKRAFSDRELTLYLGAGVSMSSGLPNWDRLILMMYLAALGDLDALDNPLEGWRVFPNYLEAIAEWLLASRVDPAEITAQKIRTMVEDDARFVGLLKDTLYAPINDSGPLENATLRAVQKLGVAGGVRAMVTYNYDDLVERDQSSLAPVWKPGHAVAKEKVPIFHVHGYLPQSGDGSRYEELILTEEQFHSAASDPYSWSNLVQMRQFGSNVGLMVGMSVTDRNLRRILEAMRKPPDRCPQYAILKCGQRELTEDDLQEIEEHAQRYGYQRKTQDRSRDEIRGIFRQLDQFDQDTTGKVLHRLGVQVLWIDSYSEIPGLLEEIGTGN